MYEEQSVADYWDDPIQASFQQEVEQAISHTYQPLFTGMKAALITLLIKREGLLGYMVGKDMKLVRSYGQAAIVY